MSAFVTHFASLLTQIPLSDNWKKTVIYFTTVASVRCHDVFFFFFPCNVFDKFQSDACHLFPGFNVFQIPASVSQDVSCRYYHILFLGALNTPFFHGDDFNLTQLNHLWLWWFNRKIPITTQDSTFYMTWLILCFFFSYILICIKARSHQCRQSLNLLCGWIRLWPLILLPPSLRL